MGQPSCSCLGWLASSVLSLHRCLTPCSVPSSALSLVTYFFLPFFVYWVAVSFYCSAVFIHRMLGFFKEKDYIKAEACFIFI